MTESTLSVYNFRSYPTNGGHPDNNPDNGIQGFL